MDSFTIRETFLRFYEERGHKRYPSASLIPNDPTLLLTNAGMVQFKPYFLGDSTPETTRATSFQKCARTVDIENVGKTTRHLTLFEMLGNFSFGDYFKRQAIAWSYELSITDFGLDPDRIWASVYEEDEEAAALWEEETDIPRERIQAMGWDDNFWWMHVAGPGGPCSELYYDRGEEWGEGGGPIANDERYLEYYNLVFMQSELDEAGNTLGDLPKQNVDTGMGLERMAVLKQDVPTVFEIDTFAPLVARAEELTGRGYGDDATVDVSLRVIAEHARTVAFLIADGVLPSKEGRGYVLRRLLRRAVRHARVLGREADVLVPMVGVAIDTMKPGYPELEAQRELVTRVAGAEEADFGRTLQQGMGILEDAVGAAKEAGEDRLPGDTVFRLHDTYGFPVDLTIEIADDLGLGIDRDEFDRLMQEQRERARAALKRGGEGIPQSVYGRAIEAVGSVAFVGYERTEEESTLGAIVTPGGLVGEAEEGDEVEIVLAATPFYAEGGGQVGDTGVLETDTGRLQVTDTQAPLEGLIVHRAVVVAGEVTSGQAVRAHVDAGLRAATARSHSATHVLHATVKDVLGGHAQQAGSLVQAGRLRFDFPHFEQVPAERLTEIEELANRRLLADPAVVADQMPLDEARAAGAVALFGEKYGDIVRVVTIGDFSKELCGGTHVPSAARVGGLVIVREESIGANQRRIEALTGEDAYRHAARERVVAEEVARLLDVSPDQAVERLQALLGRLREAEREIGRTREAELSSQARELATFAEDLPDLRLLAREVENVDANELRQLALEVRGNLGDSAVVVLGASSPDGKAQLVAVLSADLVDRGVEARAILHPAAQEVGGGAGGKGELAQAGGRDASKLPAALDVAVREARRLVGGAGA